MLPGLLLLNGCARYRAKTLKRLPTGIATHTNEETIEFAYHVFNAGDCKRYLDRDVIAAGYQPVHITFVNNTTHPVKFSPDQFSFPCAAVAEVAEEVHTNTVGRAVGYGLASTVIWPLWIPAVIDGIGSVKANKRLDADFSRKGLKEQLVAPLSTINGLVFVPTESFNDNFTFAVKDATNLHEYVFSTHNSAMHLTC
jgi:hypothetical protein